MRKVAVSHKMVGPTGVKSTQTDQPAIAPASVRRGPILSAIQSPIG